MLIEILKIWLKVLGVLLGVVVLIALPIVLNIVGLPYVVRLLVQLQLTKTTKVLDSPPRVRYLWCMRRERAERLLLNERRRNRGA